MIITKEVLNSWEACSEGIVAGELENLIGLDHSISIPQMFNRGYKKYAGWLEHKVNKYFKTLPYTVVGTFISENDTPITDAKPVEIEIPVQFEFELPDGSVKLIPYTGQDIGGSKVLVFDMNTGQYDRFDTLQEALVCRDMLEAQYINMKPYTLYEKRKVSGGTYPVADDDYYYEEIGKIWR